MRVLRRRRPPLVDGGFGGKLFDFLAALFNSAVLLGGAALFGGGAVLLGGAVLFDGTALFDFVELLLTDDGPLFAGFGVELKMPIIKFLRN